MALFGHDDNVRRLSSVHVSPGGEESCPEDGTKGGSRCTAAKARSCIKLFVAQLFSHVGLCALVIGYSLMGAVLFVYLEQQNELDTRAKVSNSRKETLDELYNITGSIRLQLILQEDRLNRLHSQVLELTELTRKCDVGRRKERRFLQSLIENCKRDNVPLSEQQCSNFCKQHKVKGKVCKTLCLTHPSPCTFWHLDSHKHPHHKHHHSMSKVNKTLNSNSRRKKVKAKFRSKRSKPENVVLSSSENFKIPKPILFTNLLPNSRKEKVEIKVNVMEKLQIRAWEPDALCGSLSCVIDPERTATLCLQTVDPQYYFQFGHPEQHKERFNVLWRDNWTEAAGKVLKTFEQKVIRKTKTDGYDGQEDKNKVQWNFSGALLYSVTVITTIGYGNIAPKTPWGRVVTILYAMVGMPLFLLWASQMGTFLAQTFQFFYANICCVMCRRGKRRRLAAAKQRKQELENLKLNEKALLASATGSLLEEEDNLDRISNKDDADLVVDKPPAYDSGIPGKLLMATPMHLANPDSGMQSQQSLDKTAPVRIEILEPTVKDILSTCAQYNLDQDQDHKDEIQGKSAVILEEIRHAEVIEQIRAKKSAESAAASAASAEATVAKLGNSAPAAATLASAASKANSAPQSPQKNGNGSKLPLVAKDDGSIYENSLGLLSPDKDTPPATRKARLGHQTVVSVGANNTNGSQAVTTTLLKSPMPVNASRETSPASSSRIRLEQQPVTGQEDSDSLLQKPKSSVTTADQQVVQGQGQVDRVPVLPVLVFVFGYIALGATIFSTWEQWSFLEGFYFSFITLTTIGFGDFVPGDAVLNAATEQGQVKLIMACVYVLMGLAVLSMSFNLMQEEIIEKFKQLAIDLGIIDEPFDEDDLSD